MNAGGVDKACKSNGSFAKWDAITSSQVREMDSGERVSNTLVRTSKTEIAHRKVG